MFLQDYLSDTLRLLPQFTWKSTIDIFIIASILFFLYRTFRTTGTWKIILGTGLAFAVFVVSYVLDLRGVAWIFSNLSEIFLIGLVIVFQPEIRRILEKMATLRSWRRVHTGEDIVFMLSSAVFEMAQKKIGAIIVFPGNDSIQDWISGGVECNAKPSVALILSIFDHHSPGHDGAVILEQGRISKFGVRLPVSESSILGERYGTRHHASLGIAEKTDSLAIAVSEERGEISAFQQGARHTLETPEQFGDMLNEHWKRADISAPFVRSSRNRILQFSYQFTLSLLIGFFIWAGVVRSENVQEYRTYSIPAEITGVAPGYIVESYRPKQIELILRGSADEFVPLNPDRLKALIPLEGMKPGNNSIEIKARHIKNLPTGLRLVSSSPEEIIAVARPIQEARARVQPGFSGKLSEELQLLDVNVYPEYVRVFIEGSPSQVDSSSPGDRAGMEDDEPKKGQRTLQTVLETQPISLDQLKESKTVRTRLIVPEGVWPVGGQWPEVEVEIKIAED